MGSGSGLSSLAYMLLRLHATTHPLPFTIGNGLERATDVGIRLMHHKDGTDAQRIIAFREAFRSSALQKNKNIS